MVEADKYLQLAMRIKSFTIATIGGDGRPDTRIIDLMLYESGEIYFLTARGKNFYRQLMAQQFVSMTGMSDNWEMVTLRGKVKQVDRKYIRKMFAANPSMNDMYPGQSADILEAFALVEGQGEIFDLHDVPIYRAEFVIGNPREVYKKGFVITGACTECGLCAEICPQQCIESGMPYIIRRAQCLHCGYCAEQCPAGAIERM